MNDDYVRQLLNGKDVKNGRNIGERGARAIEKKLGLDRNWLDQQHGPIGVETRDGKKTPTSVRAFNKAASQDDELRSVGFALSALFSRIASTSPDEAEAVAEAIREVAPARLQDPGFLLGQLLSVLDRGVQARAQGRKRAPSGGSRPKPRSRA